MKSILNLSEKEYCLYTRSMYCPFCYEKDHPLRGDVFIVWREKHQDFFIKKNHLGRKNTTRGYTPHLIAVENPLYLNGGKVTIRVSCMMQHCGIYCDFTKTEKGGVHPLTCLWEHTLNLPYSEYVALIGKWKNTGYELF